MLKYTAELSEEFRRASSLSSLETYHRVKAVPIKDLSLMKNKLMETTPLTQHNNSKMNSLHNSNDNQQINYYSHPNWKINYLGNTIRPKSYVNEDYENGQIWPNLHTRRGTSEANINKSHLLNQKNKNSQNKRILQSSKCDYQTVLRVHQPKKNHHLVNYQNKIQTAKENIKQKQISFQNPTNNPMNMRYNKYICKENNKMYIPSRIYSINNLQNIEKRIRATLGLQNIL